MKNIPDMIFKYNSNARYKLKYDIKDSTPVVKLYHLDDKEYIWERFDYFEDENMSKDEILLKSKELINLWKGEPISNLSHITRLD